MFKKTGIVLSTIAAVEASKLIGINTKSLVETQDILDIPTEDLEAQYYKHGESSLILIESGL